MDKKPVPSDTDKIINSRHSIRGFLPTKVEIGVVEQILETAKRAPSGTNMQPWKTYVVTSNALKRLSKAVLDAHNDPEFQRQSPYKYYPERFVEPYLSRRRKIGWDLYGLLGIEKGDKEKMHRQHGRNYLFFDAPVGMIFTIDETLEIGSWLDYGMFLQNIMISARGHGLDTCAQAAFAPFHQVIRPQLNIPDSEVVICGMSLGYADMTLKENSLVSERSPLKEYATFFSD